MKAENDDAKDNQALDAENTEHHHTKTESECRTMTMINIERSMSAVTKRQFAE